MYQLCNVVWYDGADAYVSKFVLETSENGEITKESKKKLLDDYFY